MHLIFLTACNQVIWEIGQVIGQRRMESEFFISMKGIDVALSIVAVQH